MRDQRELRTPQPLRKAPRPIGRIEQADHQRLGRIGRDFPVARKNRTRAGREEGIRKALQRAAAIAGFRRVAGGKNDQIGVEFELRYFAGLQHAVGTRGGRGVQWR